MTSAPTQLGELDSVHARAATGAVDQHLLPRLDLPLVPDALQRDGARLGQGRGFLVGHAGRHWRQGALWHAHVLGKPTHGTEDVGEHVVAWLESRRGPTRRLHPSGDVRPEDVVAWTQWAHDPGVQGFASQRLPVGPVERYRLHLDQHLVVLGRGLLHLREPKDVGRSISCVDNGLHGLGPPTAAYSHVGSSRGACGKAARGRGRQRRRPAAAKAA